MSYPEPMLTISGVSAAATVLSANASGPVVRPRRRPKVIVQDLTVTDQSVALHDGGNFMDLSMSHSQIARPAERYLTMEARSSHRVHVHGQLLPGHYNRRGAVSQTGARLVVKG